MKKCYNFFVCNEIWRKVHLLCLAFKSMRFRNQCRIWKHDIECIPARLWPCWRWINRKTNSWTYTFVEDSGNNLESPPQRWGFPIQCLHYIQTSSNHGGGGGVKSVSRGDCEQQGGKLHFCHNYVQENCLGYTVLPIFKTSETIHVWRKNHVNTSDLPRCQSKKKQYPVLKK